MRRVQFSETDLAGVVHFAECLRYFEEAEHDFFRSLGIPIHPMAVGDAGFQDVGGGSFGWPRVAVQCQYHQPLRFPELVGVRVTAVEMSSRTVRFGFQIVREDGGVASVASMTVACVEKDGDGGWRSRALPDAVREKLAEHVAAFEAGGKAL